MLIFSDESDYDTYRVLGSVWLSQDSFYRFEQEVLALRNDLGFWEEVKSSRLNTACLPERVDFYKEFLTKALSLPGIQIALIRYSTDTRLTRAFFPGGPHHRDFAFLKLLIAKKTPYFTAGTDGELKILHDHSEMSAAARALHVPDTFKKIIAFQTGKVVRWCRPADSKICASLQLADLITGLVRYRLQFKTNPVPNSLKGSLIEMLETKLRRDLYTPSFLTSETPYNLFLHRPNLARLVQAGIVV
jgi:hypothetical protein